MAASQAAWATQAEAWGASSHYIGQGLLGGSLATQVANVWPLIDPANVEQSSKLVATALVPVVQQHAMAARALANEHYLDQRTLSGIAEPFTPQSTALPTPQDVYQYLGWATKPARATGSGDDTDALLVPAQKNATAALQKLVADTGRQQLVQNVLGDRKAKGWAREARPDACWFCAMLATRGAVYSSAWAAGRRTFEGIDYNSYHRNCHCQVVPVFQRYEPPAHVREWQNMWQRSTKDVYGKKKLLAFKAEYLGKNVDDVSVGESHDHPAPVEVAPAFPGWDDAKLQAAIDSAEAALQAQGDDARGGRAAWIAKLKGELARRAVVV